MSWLDPFRERNLVKGGGSPSFRRVMLQGDDIQLLEKMATQLDVSPSELSSRIVSQILRRHRLHIEAGARE